MYEKKLDTPIMMRVSSGGYTANVRAHSPLEAFELFLESKNPKALGILTEIKAKGWREDDDTFYTLTTVLLEKLGRMENANN